MGEGQRFGRRARFGLLWLAVWLLAACAGVGEAALGARIDAFVRAEMQRQQVPGVAVAVLRGERAIRAAGYGVANLEHDVPVGPQTIFQSGSLGKQFTAAAVLLQVQDGKLALDEPLLRFFPDGPAAWGPIRIRHLLTHTSGIPDYTDGTLDLRRDYGEDDLARLAIALPLEFPPGTRWNYSNTGYALLGIVVRKVSGRFYGDVLRERVFAPLGMATARVISEEDLVPHRAAGYRLVDGRPKNQAWVSPTLNTTADGALYLSLNDWIAWLAGVRRGAVLGADAWAATFAPVRLASGKPYPYGFGWEVDTAGGRPRLHHGGAWQGFRAHLARYPEDDLAIVVLCNLAEGDPQRFVDGIAALVEPTLGAAPPPPGPADPRDVQRLGELLAAAADGRLTREQFAYVRAGFFPQAADAYRRRLKDLGPLLRADLLEQRELGDDRITRWRAVYAGKTLHVRLGLAPDGKVSAFSVRSE